jgi:hypothetical protein
MTNGKGDKWRMGIDYHSYWKSDYWKELEKKKTRKTENTFSKCSEPVEQTKR